MFGNTTVKRLLNYRPINAKDKIDFQRLLTAISEQGWQVKDHAIRENKSIWVTMHNEDGQAIYVEFGSKRYIDPDAKEDD